MIGWQINGEEKIEKISRTEPFDGIDNVKVKITQTLITAEDMVAYCGDDKNIVMPVIPGRLAVGIISETGSTPVFGFEKGTKVYLSPVDNCGKCYSCANGRPQECYDFRIAGKNTDGFLKDFAVMKNSLVYPLPKSVKESDAVYIDYISLCLNVIDRLKIEKGQHIAIIGGSVLASILAQLIIYYQGVPILVDNDDENLLLARKSGIYYTIKTDKKTESEVSAITGGRMASRVVYISRSGLPTDLAIKLAAPCAHLAFAGFSYPNLKVNFQVAMQKQINARCITNGYGYAETSINMLANKAIDLSNYVLPLTSMNDMPKVFAKTAEKYKSGKKFSNILINMVG